MRSFSEIRSQLRHYLTSKLQRVCWVYLTKNFIITSMAEVTPSEPTAKCLFVPITLDNCFRVAEYREAARVAEYRAKLTRGEIGFFAECEGRMIASIWATVNRTAAPAVVRAHIRLAPGEALVHDIVTGKNFRGMGVGPFMVGRLARTLLNNYRVDRIVIDVNSRNNASLRMMDKAGLKMKKQMLYVSVFSKLVLEKNVGM
jgi:RimJ/RimL family protein N-acetyltransferase